jgi:HrpA-like RNA helicase
LPQYCAENFNGLIICTQPRVLAAVSIATRIAEEYDGTAVGNNVGYKVGGSKGSEGSKIMLMTDASLISRSQDDSNLSDVGVLIIDEAHERSLNTDLVIGIAKRIRERRPHDFYIVIASATIDPKPFLAYYFGEKESLNKTALNVKGRTFQVLMAPPVLPSDKYEDVLKTLLVKTVIKSLEKYTEGHCLVFVSGSSEVDNAIRDFTSHEYYQQLWLPLPLYGGMPPEEQKKIFDFPSDGLNGSPRMVVFCTNVTETSLTVPNVQRKHDMIRRDV